MTILLCKENSNNVGKRGGGGGGVKEKRERRESAQGREKRAENRERKSIALIAHTRKGNLTWNLTWKWRIEKMRSV